ncbi:hypothetical protein L484_018646 [Morus notabilis]|uniref:Uncharacterized protein n=1 Tax=Morus notabilis TaxID=981085 RepID=W9RHS0_9ROSA|nr:hypothetical protein L484_018646 [Morus notabilis]
MGIYPNSIISNTNCPPSPTSYSVHTDSNFVFAEQGTPSGTENDDASPNGAQSTDEEIVSDVELTFPRQMTSITPYQLMSATQKLHLN